MKWNQKGEGKAGAIFGFAFFALVVYLGLKFLPVMIRMYAYEDAVREECKFLHGRSLEKLTEDLVAIAEEKELPVADENISMARVKTEQYYTLKVDIDYTVPVVTPFFTYNWQQTIAYDAPVFE